MKRRASAKWIGTGNDSKGSLTCSSGVLKDTPYSVHTDENGKTGTNPEEPIAAAHAGCFSKALSFLLSEEGFPPKEIQTEAILSVGILADPLQINSIHLDVVGKVPAISEVRFIEIAEKVKETCSVSQALKAIKITLTAQLEKPVVSKKSKSLH
jgi:osmotically inducible protein OsmC